MKDIVHRGLTWRDFPGNCEGLEGEALKLKLHELAAQKRRQFGRVGKMRLRRALAE